jgi:hypothetical protein
MCGVTSRVEEVDVQPLVPLLVGDLQQRALGPVAGAVHQRVDAAPALQGLVHQTLQVVARLVGAGDTEATEVLRKRLALAGGRQDRHPEPVRREAACHRGAYAAATGGDDGDLFC